jgi:hypothetical protein
MRLGTALVVLAAASLAACGGGKQEGVVKFRGSTPNTSVQKAKFVREYESFCPNCGAELAFGLNKCSQRKTCEGLLFTWPKELTCGSCKGTGVCTACVNMDQERDAATGQWVCYNCRGKGDLILQGQGKECPNCKGKKVCPICEGTKKCDWCKGAGKVDDAFVKKNMKKGAGDDTEPGEIKKGEAPKTDEKKAEAPKPEDKKPDGEKKEEK